jgi:hypothetical protein
MTEVADYPEDYLGDVLRILNPVEVPRPCTCGNCEECRKIMFEEEMQQEHYRRMGYIS